MNSRDSIIMKDEEGHQRAMITEGKDYNEPQDPDESSLIIMNLCQVVGWKFFEKTWFNPN